MKIRQITEMKLHIIGTEFTATGSNEKACLDAIAKEHTDYFKRDYFENLAKKNGVETEVKTLYFADTIVKHFAGSTKEEAEQIAKDFLAGIPSETDINEMAVNENED